MYKIRPIISKKHQWLVFSTFKEEERLKWQYLRKKHLNPKRTCVVHIWL